MFFRCPGLPSSRGIPADRQALSGRRPAPGWVSNQKIPRPQQCRDVRQQYRPAAELKQVNRHPVIACGHGDILNVVNLKTRQVQDENRMSHQCTGEPARVKVEK